MGAFIIKVKIGSLPSVNIKYALQLRTAAQLQHWHTLSEVNTRAMLEAEDNPEPSDADVCKLVSKLYGCTPRALAALSLEQRTQALRRLSLREQIPLAQLSRLTGISRGVIQRCCL